MYMLYTKLTMNHKAGYDWLMADPIAGCTLIGPVITEPDIIEDQLTGQDDQVSIARVP